MNHTKENLDECVFDYLTAHPNEYHSARKIFDAVRGDTGNRCEELTSSKEDRMHFTCVCYGLNNRYNNIYKRIKFGTVYLAFKSDDSSPVKSFELSDKWSDIDHVSVLENICRLNMYDNYQNSYFSEIYDGTEPLVHNIARYGSAADLDKLAKRGIDLNFQAENGRSPTDIAFECGDREKITLLLRINDRGDAASDGGASDRAREIEVGHLKLQRQLRIEVADAKARILSLKRSEEVMWRMVLPIMMFMAWWIGTICA